MNEFLINIFTENFFLIFTIVFFCFLLLLQALLYKKKLRNIRKDTLKRSKAVRDGQTLEQFAPYFSNFPANPDDAKFLGRPIDFICFNGLSSSDEVKEIVFVEVKTGESKLTPRENSIKQAILEGRIKYVEYKIK